MGRNGRLWRRSVECVNDSTSSSNIIRSLIVPKRLECIFSLVVPVVVFSLVVPVVIVVVVAVEVCSSSIPAHYPHNGTNLLFHRSVVGMLPPAGPLSCIH